MGLNTPFKINKLMRPFMKNLQFELKLMSGSPFDKFRLIGDELLFVSEDLIIDKNKELTEFTDYFDDEINYDGKKRYSQVSKFLWK